MTVKEKEKIINLWGMGNDIKSISEFLGRSQQTINRHIALIRRASGGKLCPMRPRKYKSTIESDLKTLCRRFGASYHPPKKKGRK